MADITSISTEHCLSESILSTTSSIPKRQENNKKAWFTVVGSFLVYYSSLGIINSFGFFQNHYQESFIRNTPPSTIALIGTAQIALMNLLATVSGALCDSHGIKYLYIGSGFGIAGALLVLSFSRPGSFWQVFLSQGIFMGIAIAFGVQPALTIVGQHFNRQRALAMGIVCAGSAMGGLCFPIMFSNLLGMIGFAWTLRVTAIKVISCYSVALLISESRPHEGRLRRSLLSLFDFRGFHDRRYWVLSIGASLVQLGIWVPNYYIQSYCSVAYPDSPIKNYMLPLMNASSILGMSIGGLVGDKIGRLNLLCAMTMVSGTLCLTLWLENISIAAFVLFGCLYGFSSGNYFALLAPVVSQISPDDKLGARIGAFYSIVAVASLIGSPIGGALIRNRTVEGYRGLMLYTGSVLIAGSLTILTSKFGVGMPAGLLEGARRPGFGFALLILNSIAVWYES